MRNFQLKFAVLMLIFLWGSRGQSKCSESCDSLASYKVWEGTDMTFISDMFGTSTDNILSFNPQVPSKDLISIGSRINVPFKCNCINGQFLAQNFSYKIKSHDTYTKVAQKYYANLTTVGWLIANNNFPENNIPDVDTSINVIMNCSCGDKRVSKDYGLFLTYPIEPGENLGTIANMSSLSPELLQSYNRDSNFSSGLVFIPGKNQSGIYPPLKISRDGLSRGVISGIAVGGVSGVLFLAFFVYIWFYRRKKEVEESVLLEAAEKHQFQHGSASTLEKTSETVALVASPGLTSISVDKSVEFSYEELAKATDDFNMANKIGQGGFGAVYYAEIRGEKAAIKKMDMQASKEFLAELKVLTHVHHLNLVRLIGYCFEGSLCVVYEFIENGNLSQHLRGSGTDPLPWSTRLQIALDSARGLEYIHEHTVPVYIHRDIKSANILIDRKFRAKVADFGLTKLTELGNESIYSGLRGTFGYIPPECVCGNVSPKTDVYAFGVVLYELISAKQAVVTTDETMTRSKGLVALFEEVLNQPDPREDLWKLVDPNLGDNYPLDSVTKMAELAKSCTQEDPQLRPSMRKVVVALTTLSSSTEDWDIGSLNENPTLVNLMSGK